MFEILDEVCTPTKGSEFSACVDLYAREDVIIGVGETVLVPLGVKIDQEFISMNIEDLQDEKYNHIEVYADSDWISFFKKSHQLNLHIRSSMSAKHGLIIANGTGIIDLDYPGEIMICIHKPLTLKDIVPTIIRTVQKFFRLGASSHDIPLVNPFTLKKGQLNDKGEIIAIAQIELLEHKTYLLGVETKEKRKGGFGSTDN